MHGRLARPFAVVTIVDFFVLAAVWDTIGHMWVPHGNPAGCYKDPAPFLPTHDAVCGYGAGAMVVSVAAVLLVVALLVWSNWLVAGPGAAPAARARRDGAPGRPAEPGPAHSAAH